MSAPPGKAPEPGSQAAPAGSDAEESSSPPPAPAAAPAPATGESRVTSDALEGAAEADGEGELAQAERELDAADQELSAQTQVGASEGPRHEGGAGRGSGAAKPKSSAPQQKPCDTTCRAFASLIRARDSICRIDGSDGERCSRANQIVERHSVRSASCGCGS